jgi:four helix bundle protein
MDLGHGVYQLTRDRFFSQPGDLRDQLRRAALSVSNNIAEGFERGSTSELVAFLYIARGSAGEVRSMLHFIEGASQATHLKTKMLELIALAEDCSIQIHGWAGQLQNSELKGQRHQTEKSMRNYRIQKEREEFLHELDEIMRKSQSGRPAEDA